MNKHNTTLIIIGIIGLAVITFLSIVKCADNKVNVLWPEGRVITR